MQMTSSSPWIMAAQALSHSSLYQLCKCQILPESLKFCSDWNFLQDSVNDMVSWLTVNDMVSWHPSVHTTWYFYFVSIFSEKEKRILISFWPTILTDVDRNSQEKINLGCDWIHSHPLFNIWPVDTWQI